MTSRNLGVLTLVMSSIFCSRAVFYFFQDPEGLNLLVVLVLAAILFVTTIAMYITLTRMVSWPEMKRVLAAVLFQAILAVGIFFLMK